MRLRGVVALAFAVLVLSGCSGGGGGGSQPPQPQVTLSGTVAGDVPIPSYTVSILSPTGVTSAFLATGSTGADGRYSAISFLPNPPFLVLASPQPQQEHPQYPRLTSIAHRGGTANVTALSSLLVARLVNRSPEIFIDTWAAFDLRTRSESDVQAARQQVVAYLLNRPDKNDGNSTTSVDVSAVTDFVSGPLTAVSGDPHFEALRRVHASMMDSETVRGMEEHMLFGGDLPADLRSMLALDFVATCTLLLPNNDDGTLPRGMTHIILDQRAITVGSVDLPFQSGDQLQLNASRSFAAQWTFSFATSRTVELSVHGGRVDTIVLTIPTKGSSQCQPTTDVSVLGKHPSMIALIRMFEQSISAPRSFSCAGTPTFSGFVTGQNTLAIEASGALRINGPGGPAIHLPSLFLFVTASVTVSGPQVQAIRPTLFLANGGGVLLDSLAVETNVGQITRLSMSRQRPGQPSQTQTCS